MARDQRRMCALALVSSALVLAASAIGLGVELAHAAPVLVLLLPLLAGRFVGEEAIARAVRSARQRPRRVAKSMPAGRRRSAALLPRGGRLIATCLAGRPPPASSLA